MTWWRRLISRDRLESQLDAELRDHFDRLVADHRRAGQSDAEARLLARLEFGGLDQVKEACRDERGTRLIEETAQDMRYGARGFRKNPAFTLVAVLTLALGVGANLTIFNLVDALLLRPLPVPEPSQLVKLTRWMNNNSSDHFSYPQVQALAARRELFRVFCGIGSDTVYVGAAGALEPVGAAWVSGGYFETMGITPLAGRLLAPADDEPGASPAAVITHGYWQRRFGGMADTVGKLLPIEGQQVPIVGITPRGFSGATVGESADITLAIAARPQLQPENDSFLTIDARWLRVLGRPQQELSREQVQARLDVAWAQVLLETTSPSLSAESRKRALSMTLTVDPGVAGTSQLRDRFGAPLRVLMGLVTLVLLMACVNVANLLLARGAAREREMALRLAIGAGRARIVRQLLVESAMLATMGTGAGLLLAWLGSSGLVGLIAASIAGRDTELLMLDIAPNWRIVAITATLAAATTLAFGMAPAWRAAAVVPRAVASPATRVTHSHRRLSSALIVAQVTLSLLLLIGAALFARSLYTLRSIDRGFESGGVVLASINPTRARLSSPELQAFNRALLQDAERMRGVRAVSLAAITPLQGGGMSNSLAVNGVSSGTEEVYFNIIGPRFFEILGTPMVAGRDFTPADDANAPPVAIVNETFVRQYSAGASPFSTRIRMSGAQQEMQVIGVVKDAVYESLRFAPPPTVYFSYLQSRGRPMTLVIDAGAPLADVAATIRSDLQPRAPANPIRIRSFAAQIDNSLFRERLMVWLTSIFGSLALVLAAVGLYGLMSYSVTTRSREIGVRLALGARPARIQWMVLWSALRLVAIGVTIGLPAAWLVSRLISRLVFGLSAADTAMAIVGVAVLIAVGTLAAFIPARRAARLDPVTAIHVE